jgi:hypothetical protein
VPDPADSIAMSFNGAPATVWTNDAARQGKKTVYTQVRRRRAGCKPGVNRV